MQLHGWEAALFYVLAIMTLFMAVFVVTARVAVHSALFLISTLVNVALLFILLHAEFVAGVRIFVYVGGVMVLFLFVIMLVQTRAEEESRVRLYTRADLAGRDHSAAARGVILFRDESRARGFQTLRRRSSGPGGSGRHRTDDCRCRAEHLQGHPGSRRTALPAGGFAF